VLPPSPYATSPSVDSVSGGFSLVDVVSYFSSSVPRKNNRYPCEFLALSVGARGRNEKVAPQTPPPPPPPAPPSQNIL